MITGGGQSDVFCSAVETFDGGCISVGCSKSNDNGISGNHGDYDYWIVKFRPGPLTGVESHANPASISVLPNPTTGYIKISNAGKANIKVYSTIGTLIKEAGNTDNITISEFPAGLYFVKVFDRTGTPLLQTKVVKY